MDAEENLFGRTGFYGWTQKKIFLGVQDFTDGRRRKSFWAYRILRMDVEENLFGRAGFYGWTQKKIFLGVQDFTERNY